MGEEDWKEAMFIRNHSHYTLLQSSSKIKKMIERAKELNFKFLGLTDLVSVSGCVEFIDECVKNDIHPIVGSEFILDSGYRITLICKNMEGWKDLLKLISLANDHDELFIKLDDINPENLICIDGYLHSALFGEIVKDVKSAYKCFNVHDTEFIFTDYREKIKSHVNNMAEKFNDYYIEIDNITTDELAISQIITRIIKENINPKNLIPNTSSYYCRENDVEDHKVLLCVNKKTNLRNLNEKIETSKDYELIKFISSNDHHIHDISKHYTEEQITRLCSIFEKCEELKLKAKPRLPKFETPNGETELEYLKTLCKKRNHLIPADKKEIYKERFEDEIRVIEKANLAGYFLIVQDYVNYFKSQGYFIGPGRGSAGGSLVSYLLGIIDIDPIKYDLIFSRFYNEGRNTDDHISLPDIDVDFPPNIRDDVIQYAKDKYGKDNVCQMITYGKMAGRSIIKEVLRANESCSFDQMNQITSKIPQEAAISDLLEEMDDPSVIRWALEHDPQALSDYCWINKKGELEGDFAKEFEQALRMEGIYKVQGKHAAGVVVSCDPLEEVCPMIRTHGHEEKIAAMEMNRLEEIGCPKFDILGVALLQVMMDIVNDKD